MVVTKAVEGLDCSFSVFFPFVTNKRKATRLSRILVLHLAKNKLKEMCVKIPWEKATQQNVKRVLN